MTVAKEITAMTRRAFGWLGWSLLLLASVYAAAGLAGSAVPANAGVAQPAEGVRIYVESNGVHTGLVMPVSAAGVDWRADFPASDIGDPRYAALGWVTVGWGDRAFYVETPTWADVRPLTVLRAAIGSRRTVLHVEHTNEPPAGPDDRAIILTPDQYRRLAAYVRTSRGPGGKVAAGYGGYDVFYDGTGTYSAIDTCNEWTGRALREAGVRVGAWTPFPVGVMGWF
jgi:uncharacterized protein (TIGR02117 family)